MTAFEYLAVLISIVLGLGVTELRRVRLFFAIMDGHAAGSGACAAHP